MTASVTCERVKPSMCTMKGSRTRGSSAMRKAHRVRSKISWLLAAKTCIQPVYVALIASE
jgi:hypothetical protein